MAETCPRTGAYLPLFAKPAIAKLFPKNKPLFPDCRQPDPFMGRKMMDEMGLEYVANTRYPKPCNQEGRYCLCKTYDDAKKRCIAKGEGWRWGVGKKP